jgi:hypothetical protein
MRRRVPIFPGARWSFPRSALVRINEYAVDVMSWLAWLVLAVLVTAAAAVTGIKPKGTRPVAHTRLMGGARIALCAIVIILAYLAFRARAGG